MLHASLYVILCTAKNRARVRLRRLREPRYLLGAIVGVAYFYFSFFARARTSRAGAARRAPRGAAALPPALAVLVAAGPAFAGIAFLVVTALSWILPGSSGLLDFSDAEIQFLFPAPISRRQLLVHRMLRSQLGLLFASVVVALVTPSVAGYGRLRVSIAMWMVLVTAKVYFAGVTLARTKFASASTRARRVAWLPVGALTIAVGIVAIALGRAYIDPPLDGAVDLLTRTADVAARAPARVVLWPFVTVVRPLFAPWPDAYVSALAMAALVLAITVAWVLQSDQAFQEATSATVERRSAEPAAKRVSYRVRSGAWSLATQGRAETAFAWKAALQTVRIVDRATLARFAAILVSLTIAAMSFGRASGLAATIGVFATIGSGVAILFAPQVLRIDIRQDLQHLEVLKTWPVASAAIIRGELIWPGTLITGFAWLALALATAMSATVFARIGLSWRLAIGTAVGIVAPALVFAQLAIHNGVALVFPAWVPLGNQRPRGLDAMGQRLILLGGTWLLLIVMTLPGAIAGGIVWFASAQIVGSAIALVPAAIVCAVIVAIEVLLATEALGGAYERLDITSVERSE